MEAMRCLVEVVTLDFDVSSPVSVSVSQDSQASKLVNLFKRTIATVRQSLDAVEDIAGLLETAVASPNVQLAQFVHQIALFLVAFLAKYARIVEIAHFGAHSHLGLALQYLLRFTNSNVRFHFAFLLLK